jgi:hypothetical protein
MTRHLGCDGGIDGEIDEGAEIDDRSQDPSHDEPEDQKGNTVEAIHGDTRVLHQGRVLGLTR